MGEQNHGRTTTISGIPISTDLWALHESLPHTLPADEILAVNKPKPELHTHRMYTYNGWSFELPPGVFMPGETSRMVHDRLLDGTIPVAGRSYAAMGVGLGVEAVAAGIREAREIYAIDVDPDSVKAVADHYARIVGERPGTAFHPLVSDLFDELPDSAKVDVITFNPPAVRETVSDDPTVVRNVCVGKDIAVRFFDQIVQRDLLADDGEVYLIVSNTADIRDIIKYAIESGFAPEVIHRQTWDTDNVQTYLFRMRRNMAA
ncbi:methyltransferase [Streptomyces sp. DG2A-72]|uniref:methyltransferase n=1 Tax=Streptomyces sp. DG2A-72 TaxID=3051386 RepID=UPI00265BDFE0|nr:methyltransferase [Streptomyces sp. DG2A-72]MDO0939114.1 methyltransferase [Streptomyces sp. DG2A-72]